MALTYPPGFPAQFLPNVIRAEAEQTVLLRAALRYRQVDHGFAKAAVTDYVTVTARAFAHQACEAASAGSWPLEEIDPAVDDFLWRLTVHAFFEFGLQWLWGKHEFLVAEISPRVKASPAWDEYQRERAAVAEVRSRAKDTRRGTQLGAAEPTVATAAAASSSPSDTTVETQPAGLPLVSPTPSQESVRNGRAMLEKFKDSVERDTGWRPLDIDIVLAAEYRKKSRNLLGRFLKNPNGPEASAQKFRRVLKMKSDEFRILVGRRRSPK